MDSITDISIVIPVYYNAGTIALTFDKIYSSVIQQNPDLVFEVIFVDDGSKDDSLEEIMKKKGSFPKLIKIIKLTRNFGQPQAFQAGYSLSKGKCIVNISADLQDDPMLINKMIQAYFKEGYEIVICARKDRDEGYFRKLTSRLFYKTIKKLSFPEMPIGGFDYALISHNVKNIITERRELNSFWQGQILWTGYKVKTILYERKKREIGKSKWTLTKKVKYMIDGVMSYSYFPLRLMTISGFLVALAGFIYALVIIFAKIFGNVPFKGWAPIMVLILVLSGIQMLMLGIIGEYLWRTLDQVRNRPQYIIEKIFE